MDGKGESVESFVSREGRISGVRAREDSGLQSVHHDGIVRCWAKVDFEVYARAPLRAHGLVRDVPLHDVWRVDLPGGGAQRTMLDVRAVGRRLRPGVATRALFRLRTSAGRLFGWDRSSSDGTGLLAARLDAGDRERSLVDPGSADGPFRVVYVFEREALSEIRNATVFAALVSWLEPVETGYRLYWAVHVRSVQRWTGAYMRLIGPFRRFVVYPSLLRGMHRAWAQEFSGDPSAQA